MMGGGAGEWVQLAACEMDNSSGHCRQRWSGGSKRDRPTDPTQAPPLPNGGMWCGVVWCGVVWCVVVWRGVAWCGVVWCVFVSLFVCMRVVVCVSVCICG